LTTTTTEAAAVYLLLAGLSLTLGFALGVLIAVTLLIYRRRWLSKLRDRLASDGITGSEVVWFRSELTSAERKALAEIEQSNPLLADAYMETLASRLTASRIVSRSKREMLKVERQLNRARTIRTPESRALQKELTADRERLDQVRQQASDHLAKARTRLQTIEATASRKLSQGETDLMMQRLEVLRTSCRSCSRWHNSNSKHCAKLTSTRASPDRKAATNFTKNYTKAVLCIWCTGSVSL